MKIYEALRKDHVEVKALLQRLVELDEDTDARTRVQLIDKIRDALIPHSRAEETVFYNSLREVPHAKDVIGHAYQEHLEAETLLRTLQVAGKVDAGWLKAATGLKNALEHHIDEEEGRMFAIAEGVFTDEEAVMMAQAFTKLKPEIKAESLMATTAELIANMMPPRFAKAFKKYNLESRI